MAWREGTTVGNYKIQEQLGQGGMATVYKAYHESLDRHVAVKVMHQNFLDDETFVARFQREAQLVAKLTHPHIVPVYDFGEHDQRPYLVMKYIEGETLKQRLKNGALELDEILHVLTAVGSALTYAHKQDILHRDIKPSNIVIDTANVPYLTDFGLARLASSGESTMSADMLLGTPHYISPEQAKGESNIDGRADIYSLGVVLYELLVGHVPFTADTPYAIIHDHIYRPLPSPSDVNPEIPPAVEVVLYTALEKAASERYVTADEMIQDLRDAIEESRLETLNPNRVSVASTSIARMRDDARFTEATPQLVKNPAQNTPVLTATDLRTATAKTVSAEDRTNYWQASGCVSFVVIAFVMILLLLNMSSNIVEIATIANEMDVASSVGQSTEQVDVFEQVGIDYREEELRYDVRSIPLEEAQTILEEFPEDERSYLLIARRLWDDNEDERAREAIFEGLPYTENITIYLNSAWIMAASEGDEEAALALSVATLESASDDMGLALQLRQRITEYIYQTAGDNPSMNVSDLMGGIIDRDMTQLDFLGNARDSEAVRFAALRGLIVNENTRLARLGLAGTTSLRMLQPEFALLRAEFLIMQDEIENAQTVLNGILEAQPIPRWIEDRAEELLNDLNG